MNAKTILIVAALIASLQLGPAVCAQPPEAADGWKDGRRARLLSSLSEDERARLRSAHYKALADPAVQAAKDRMRQAKRDFRDLKRATMLRADPSLQPVLDKIPARGGRDS